MNGKECDLWFINENQEVMDVDLRALGNKTI